MAKNIIICCDGTSNDFGDKPSNVVKLFALLQKDPARQLVYYDPGVGTPSTYDAFNPITKKLKYIFGQSFGYGLSDNIMEAYKFLMQCYEDGDQLYFFGFSRGSYTVRALAGLIEVCGLLHANCQNLVPEAMRIYYNRKFSEKPRDNAGNITGPSIAAKFKETFGRTVQIHFLGLWDTVSSVGWIYNPVTLQATSTNPGVKNVRHAISIDERRAFFRQNLWGKLRVKDDFIQQDVKQVWFAGVHSDVGGSYAMEESALSNIALEWMLLEALGKGLIISDIEKARQTVQAIEQPHLKEKHESLEGFWKIAEYWMKIVRVNIEKDKDKKPHWVSRPYFNRGRFRFMPEKEKQTLHESVLLRLQQLNTYRPKNVMGICKEVNAVTEKFEIEKWVKL
jgi:uncharacterized protein (DUF2235 family)